MATLEKRLYKGDRAREVLENEVFQQVFTDIEQEWTEVWKKSPQRDVEARERIHLAISMLAKVKACLQTTLETGTLAKLDLQHRQTLADRAKDWLGRK